MPKTSRPPNFIVPRAAMMTWAFAYKEDDGRDNLKAIHFEKRIEGPRKTPTTVIHAVATDGHRLIHLWWDGTPDDVLDEPIEIESEAVDFLLKDLNGEKGGTIFSRGKDFVYRVRTEKDGYVIVAEKNGEAAAWVDAGKIDHGRLAFPDWRTVMPKWQDGEHKFPMSFGVNFEYVLDFHRFLKEFGQGTDVKISYPAVDTAGAMIFAPCVPSEEEQYEVDFLLLDQATAVEYILMPVRV